MPGSRPFGPSLVAYAYKIDKSVPVNHAVIIRAVNAVICVTEEGMASPDTLLPSFTTAFIDLYLNTF